MKNDVQISFIGLGPMGKALARRLLEAGRKITVANRSPEKADPFERLGASVATPSAAVSSAELVIVCVADEPASRGILLQHELSTQPLAGKTIVVLSTMDEQQASALATDVSAAGGEFLCGSILGYPTNVVESDCTVVFSGSRQAFDCYQPLFESLGGRADFLSVEPGAVTIFDRAVFAAHYGAVIAFIQGATMACAAGVPMPLYVREATAGQLDFNYYADQILRADYAPDEASIDTEADAYSGVPETLRQLHLNPDLADAVKAVFDQARAMGLGQNSVAALSEVFRIKRG